MAAPSRRNRVSFNFNRCLATLENYVAPNAFMVLCFFVYINATLLMFFWGARDQYKHTPDAEYVWFITIARGFGYVLNLNCGLVILLACRLLLTYIRHTSLNLFLPFDKLFPAFHMVVGYTITTAVVGHAAFHLVWVVRWQNWQSGLLGVTMTVATGFSLALVLLILVITSLPSFRSKHFKFFYISHSLCAFLFFSLLLVHGVYNGNSYTYKWITGPLILYAIDRVLRKWAVQTSALQLRGMKSMLKTKSVLRLEMPKPFDYQAGQYAEIQVPSISRSEWHPFTIASAPYESNMTFYIKSTGDWTDRLRKEMESLISGGEEKPLDVLVRGPYGAPAQHVNGYDRILLISGGIGATPFVSIAKYINYVIEGQSKNDEGTSTTDGDDIVPKANEGLRKSMNIAYEEDSSTSESDFDSLATPKALAYQEPVMTELRVSGPPKTKGDGTAEWKSADVLGRSFRERSVNDWADDGSYTTEFASSTMKIDNVQVAKSIQERVEMAKSSRMVLFFRSVTVNMSLCLLMTMRVVVVAYVHLFHVSPGNFSMELPNVSEQHGWMTALDLVLGLAMFLIFGATVAVEARMYGKKYFTSMRRKIDLLALLPLSLGSNFLGLFLLVTTYRVPKLMVIFHFCVVMISLLLLLVYRLASVIGSRILQADRVGDQWFNDLRSVDFMWTTPTEGDDEWIRDEFSDLADGKRLRLHRYVTRGNAEDYLESGPLNTDALTTNIGRPDWDDVFRKIVERTPSGKRVGVFFCGPHMMADAIEVAMKKARKMSMMRGLYLGSSDVRVKRELNVGQGEELEALRARGCNVMFVLRKENFG